MLRRSLTFSIVLALIAAGAFLVYFNSAPASLKLAPSLEFTFPLGWLIFAAACFGAVIVLILLILREGRWALRQWRVQRAQRLQERNSQYKAEARLLILAGRHDKARQLLQKTAKSSNSQVIDIIDIAESYLLEGRAQDARKVAEDGIRDFGNNTLLLHVLAKALIAGGDKSAAVAPLQSALETSPNSVVLLKMLRDVFIDTELWARAEQPQTRIVEILSSDQREKDLLLHIRLKACLGSPEIERGAALKALTSIDADFTPAIVERVHLAVAQDKTKAALKLLGKSLKRRVDPVLLDELEAILGVKDEARLLAIYDKLRSGSGVGADIVTLRLARHMIARGKLDEAGQLLDEMNSSQGCPSDTEINLTRAELAQARADYQSAASIYRQIALKSSGN